MKEKTGITDNESKINVLFVSHSCLSYGAERSLLSLVTSLANNSNFNPIVLIPCKGYMYKKFHENNIDFIVFPYFNWISSLKRLPFNFLGFITNFILANVLAKKIKNKNIDIIYTNSLATNFGGLLASKLKCPHIWHIREFVHEDLGRFFIPGSHYVKEFIEKTTNQIVYNSEAVSDKFSRLFTCIESSIVYNGFYFEDERTLIKDRHQLLIADKNRINLLVIGTIRREKGQHEAIKCLIELIRRGLKVELNIVGKGNSFYIKKLRKLCKRAEVLEFVNFVGLVENPKQYYREAAITLVPSSNEAFGRVVVESCSVGCPVVVSDKGGLKEIIRDGETGLIYELGNIEQLADQVEKLITEKSLYNYIVEQSAIDVRKKFSHEIYKKNIESRLRSVLNR